MAHTHCVPEKIANEINTHALAGVARLSAQADSFHRSDQNLSQIQRP
jgi:hypothetical protein